jgi:hypothetical protein
LPGDNVFTREETPSKPGKRFVCSAGKSVVEALYHLGLTSAKMPEDRYEIEDRLTE